MHTPLSFSPQFVTMNHIFLHFIFCLVTFSFRRYTIHHLKQWQCLERNAYRNVYDLSNPAYYRQRYIYIAVMNHQNNFKKSGTEFSMVQVSAWCCSQITQCNCHQHRYTRLQQNTETRIGFICAHDGILFYSIILCLLHFRPSDHKLFGILVFLSNFTKIVVFSGLHQSLPGVESTLLVGEWSTRTVSPTGDTSET